MDELNKNNESEVIEEIVFAPASMWKRLGAFIIDLLIAGIASFIISIAIAIVFFILNGPYSEMSDKTIDILIFLMAIPGEFLYFSLMESSRFQATFGKMVFNIKVTDYNIERIKYWRSAVRTLSKYISAGLFYLGYLVGFLTEYTQMLHDFLAKTYVVDATPVRQVEEINEVQEDSAQ